MKKTQLIEAERDVATAGLESPLDLLRHMGGRAHRVRDGREKKVDCMLAVYKDRLTYTFILENEVASIHFDSGRGEIFFRGHNISHLELTEEQRKALLELRIILEEDLEGRELLPRYVATLDRVLADK